MFYLRNVVLIWIESFIETGEQDHMSSSRQLSIRCLIEKNPQNISCIQLHFQKQSLKTLNI